MRPVQGARRGSARLLAVLLALLALGTLGLVLTFLGAGRASEGLARDEELSGLSPARGSAPLQPGSGLEREVSAETERRVEAAPEALAELEAVASVEPRSWSGTVRSRLTREPLAGVALVLRSGTEKSAAHSDERGAFELSWSSAATPTLEAALEGFVTLRLAAVDFDQPELLELTPGAELRVALRGPGPLELEGVEASLWDLTLDRRTRGRGEQAYADEDGVFHFSELASGEYSVGVHVPGWSLAYEHRVLLEAGERVDLMLEPARGALLRGIVRWVGDGEPVVGAEVRFLPDLSGTSSSVERLARLEVATDAAGRFELGGLSTGRGSLRVETEEGAWRNQDVFLEEPGSQLEVELELARPGSLAGRVVDQRGQGVAGVRLAVAWQNPGVQRLREPDPEGRNQTLVSCDLNGRFLVTGLPAKRSLHLGASKLEGDEVTAFRTLRLSGLESAEEREGVELVLIDTLRITGEVRDELGAPIAGARVRASRLSRGGASRFDEVESAADGSFELKGLHPGRYRVDARDARDTAVLEQHLGSSEEVELSDDGPPVSVVLELPRCLALEGWVVDEWGVAVHDARIRARAVSFGGEEGGRDLSARSDEFGRFELGRMSEGSYALSASATGYESTAEDVLVTVPGHDSARLVLRRRELVERVVLHGTARLESGAAPIALSLRDSRGGSFSQAGTSFRVTGVRPGRVRLELRARDQIPVLLEPLDLLPGSEVDLGDVRFERAGSVRVEVRKKDGTPLAGFKARLAPLSLDEGGNAGKAIGLERERIRRKPGQSGPLPQVASSSRVPLKNWRLVVERSGFKTHRQVIGLDAQRTSRRLVVVLEPNQP